MDINKIIGLLEGLEGGSTDYIGHKMIVSKKNSETGYGQITIPKKDYQKAIKLFEDYLNIDFDLETFKGKFKDRHFLDEGNLLRLSCVPFFTKLEPGDVIYLQPAGPGKVKATKEEPIKVEDAIRDLRVLEEFKKGAIKLLKLICN